MPAVDYDLLADLYDGLVTGGDDVPFFVRHARTARGPVLELMAGTGRVSLPVVVAGVDLTCLDASTGMLAVLRRKLEARGSSADVVCQDAASFELGRRFALIFIAYNSFSEVVGDDERRSLLEHVRDHLLPGGRFLCTLQDPELRRRAPEADGERRMPFQAPDGRRLVLVLRMTFDPETLLGSGTERIEEAETGRVVVELPIRFRLTTADGFRKLAEDTGFEIESLDGGFSRQPYVPGRTPQMVWTLRRPRPHARRS